MAKGYKTGGRVKGTPNKDNPLKGYLRTHSLAYFQPKPQVDRNGNPREITRVVDDVILPPVLLCDGKGKPLVMSDFEVDMMQIDAKERVNAELRLLEFHTPKMKAVEVDMEVAATTLTIEDRLRRLCGDPPDDD